MMHWILLPFSIIYGIVVFIRNKLFDTGWIKSKSFDIPVINIGNISVGGTGKTPHTEYLISILNKYKVAVVSRGYKRKTKGFVEASTNSKVTDVGDEPLQIKQKFSNITVVVDEKRVHAVENLLNKQNKPDVILLDDAYQHRYIKPGLNILLVDYNRPIFKDFILPVGRLREPAHNSKRADIIIFTKCPDSLTPIDFNLLKKEMHIFPYQKVFFTTFKYGNIIPIFNEDLKIISTENLSGKDILVVSGIANPKPLYKKLLETDASITMLQFSDHHEFTKNDIKKIITGFNQIKSDNKILLCTEKDAVRFKTNNISNELIELPFYYLPIEVTFLNNQEKEFADTINKYMSRYKLKANL